MESVSVSRHLDAPPEQVREAMADLEEFMLGAGFTDATVDGDDLHIENRVGLVGEILDATVIERQRRSELTSQFDWLAEQVES